MQPVGALCLFIRLFRWRNSNEVALHPIPYQFPRLEHAPVFFSFCTIIVPISMPFLSRHLCHTFHTAKVHIVLFWLGTLPTYPHHHHHKLFDWNCFSASPVTEVCSFKKPEIQPMSHGSNETEYPKLEVKKRTAPAYQFSSFLSFFFSLFTSASSLSAGKKLNFSLKMVFSLANDKTMTSWCWESWKKSLALAVC